MQRAPDVLVLDAGADHSVAEIEQVLFDRDKQFALTEDDARRTFGRICNCRCENIADHAGTDGGIA